MEALGRADYALKRYALASNPSDWAARSEEIMRLVPRSCEWALEAATSTDSCVPCGSWASRPWRVLSDYPYNRPDTPVE